MDRKKRILIIAFLVFFFVLIVPIAINECYKFGAGYITIWGAEDVLSYYGTVLGMVLGAVVTFGSLYITISFTRKQILREDYIKKENEKWAKIEAVFIGALDQISPMQPAVKTMSTGLTNPVAAINTIQEYQIYCKIATDQLNSCLNILDYPNVKSLIDGIGSATEKFFQTCQELIEEYSKLRDFMSRNTAKETLEMELKYPGSFPIETLSFCKKIIKDTDGFCVEDFQRTIGELNAKMTLLYQSTYRNLLQLKGSTFEQIHTEIQAKADAILSFRGEK